MIKTVFLASTFLCLAVPAAAQTATGVGVGTGISASRAKSTAVAISGQGGAGGNAAATGNGNSTLTINSPTVPTATTSTTTIHNTGSVSNVPAVFAPGLAAAGLETCLGSVSVGASWLGTGLTGGGSIPDPGCAARLDARTLWSMGLKQAAVARLCLNPDIYRSMPQVCVQYLPVATPEGYVAPAAYGAYASTSPGGTIDVIEGKTGRTRPCSDYDEPHHRCKAWADAEPVRVAAVHKPKPRPVVASPETQPQ